MEEHAERMVRGWLWGRRAGPAAALASIRGSPARSRAWKNMLNGWSEAGSGGAAPARPRHGLRSVPHRPGQGHEDHAERMVRGWLWRRRAGPAAALASIRASPARSRAWKNMLNGWSEAGSGGAAPARPRHRQDCADVGSIDVDLETPAG